MAVFRITEEASHIHHAKKQVDDFLDSNKMYSNMQLDIMMVPEFLGYKIYSKQLPADVLAVSHKEDGKLTIYVQDGEMDRTKALAFCYLLGYEYYEQKNNKTTLEQALDNYEEAFDNLFYIKASTKGVKKWYDSLQEQEKKAMIEWELKTGFANYVVSVGENELNKNDNLAFFAKDLLSRDYLPRFKEKQSEQGFDL